MMKLDSGTLFYGALFFFAYILFIDSNLLLDLIESLNLDSGLLNLAIYYLLMMFIVYFLININPVFSLSVPFISEYVSTYSGYLSNYLMTKIESKHKREEPKKESKKETKKVNNNPPEVKKPVVTFFGKEITPEDQKILFKIGTDIYRAFI